MGAYVFVSLCVCVCVYEGMHARARTFLFTIQKYFTGQFKSLNKLSF